MHPPGAVRWRVLRVVLGLVASTALYYYLLYLLRAVGTSVGLALVLVTGALVSAVPALVPLARGRRLDGLSAFLTVMLLGGVAVSLLPGNARFLLAKEALLTGTTGVWFIASTRGSRPLAYLFARPLAEGRLWWPAHWEWLWATSPRFRRMWRQSSVMWGVGTLTDAALRVLMAYTLRPDAVPALNLVLLAATTVVLNVVTNVYYAACGVYDRHGPFHRPILAPGGRGQARDVETTHR